MENLNNGMVENAVMVMDGADNFIVDLTDTRTAMFSSMAVDTPQQKATLFKAMNNPEKRIGDCINMEIDVKDVFCEVVTCTNKESGEVTQCPRIVLIDKDGVGYQAVSIGIYSALKKVFAVFGTPTWETPIKIKIVQISKGDRKMLTFDVVA